MRPRLLALLVAAATLGASPALAQHAADAPKADAPKADAPKADARKPPPTPAEIAQKGQELCDRGDTQEAITQLASALVQKPDPEIAAALAGCEVKTSRWAAAADHLVVALRGTPEGGPRISLEERFAAVRAHVGTLTITVNVEGADVFVGDRLVGQTPLKGEVFADPGKSVVSVKKTNFDEAAKIVEVAARGTATVSFELSPGGQSPNPYAQASRLKTPFYVLGGVGVVAAAAGAAFLAAAVSKGAAADALLAELEAGYPAQGATPCKPANAGCATVASLRSGHDTDLNVATGLLTSGGVLLGAAILYGVWAFSGSSPASGSVTLAPVALPSGGGLSMHGTF